MPERPIWIKLRKIESRLRRDLARVRLIGELRTTKENYLKLAFETNQMLAGQSEQLKEVPDCVLLALMVFCARYEDTSEEGFWAIFLCRIGLPNEGRIQRLCREQFKRAKQNLSRTHKQLYFPDEGRRVCVTPILYHAVIPQVCVQEMADLLRSAGQNAGWDAIIQMELEELESQLSSAVVRSHATKTLSLFVSHTNSRRIAAQLFYDLCDAANLHQRGELTAEQIKYLISDNPVQRELWEALMAKSAPEKKGVSLHSLMAAPRWQWDIRARRLRLYLPRQTMFSLVRPAALAIKKEHYPVQVRRDGNLWEIEPTVLSRLPIDWPDPSGFSLELRDKDDHCLRRWLVKPPESGVLFFQSNSARTLASYVNAEIGLPPGESLVIHRRNLRLQDEQGEVEPVYREQPPLGFERDYQAVSVWLQPPVAVFATGDDEEWVSRYLPLPETPHLLKLEGEVLSEADDPSGASIYNGTAPELRLTAHSYDEVKNLQLQLRDLSAKDATTLLFPVHSLVRESIAVWSDYHQELRVDLNGILLDRKGRFRIKLLHGLQSARYAPVEFVVTPQIRISPLNHEFDQMLFADETPPQIELICSGASALTSQSGQVKTVTRGVYRIGWPVWANEFVAVLDFGYFKVPLRWRPHLLRAGIFSKGAVDCWTEQLPTLQLEHLTFDHSIRIEAIEGAKYQIIVGEIVTPQKMFGDPPRLELPLAAFKDGARSSMLGYVPVRIGVHFRSHDYQLNLLHILKQNGKHNGAHPGEPISHFRTGQRVIHPDYGLGELESFVDERINDDLINLARFHFYKYDNVQFFIPSSRHLPIYSRIATRISTGFSSGAWT